MSINNFYALEGGPLAPGPTGYTPDGGVMAYWTQTIGSQPATFSNYQTGTAPQGPLLNLSQDNNNFSSGWVSTGGPVRRAHLPHDQRRLSGSGV